MAIELFDLDEAARHEPDDAARASLVRAIRQAVSMSSVKNDLGRAREMMEELKAVQAVAIRHNDEGRPIVRGVGATVQALFMQAVSLYVRATHSGGKGRNKLHVVDRLDAGVLEIHGRITLLRDRYLAHFDEPADWEHAFVVLALDLAEARMSLSYPHSRYYVRADDSADFDILLSVVERLCADAYASASARLNLLVNGRFEDDPDFLDRIRSHPFKPADFFDAEEVGPYLTSIGAQHPDPPTNPRLVRPRR